MPRNLGFSLLEILIAIAVLSIATAIAIPNLRKFNEDQSLTNAKGDFVRSFRQALTNAQAGTNCKDNKGASVIWKLVLFSDNYTLKADCKDSNNVTAVDLLQSQTYPPSVTFKYYCPSGQMLGTQTITFPSIAFAGGTSSFPCPTGQTFTVKLTSAKTNLSQCINIENGGAIYEIPSSSCPVP